MEKADWLHWEMALFTTHWRLTARPLWLYRPLPESNECHYSSEDQEAPATWSWNLIEVTCPEGATCGKACWLLDERPCPWAMSVLGSCWCLYSAPFLKWSQGHNISFGVWCHFYWEILIVENWYFSLDGTKKNCKSFISSKVFPALGLCKLQSGHIQSHYITQQVLVLSLCQCGCNGARCFLLPKKAEYYDRPDSVCTHFPLYSIFSAVTKNSLSNWKLSLTTLGVWLKKTCFCFFTGYLTPIAFEGC